MRRLFFGSRRARPRTVSLRVRLTASAVIVMALVAAERTYSIVKLHADNLAVAEDHVLDLMERGVSQFRITIAEQRAVLTTLAALPGTVPADTVPPLASDAEPSSPDPDTIPNTPTYCHNLEKLVDNSPSLDSLSIVAPNGIVRCSTAAGAVGLDISDRDYFRIAMRGIPSLESVSRSYVTGKPNLYMAQPVVEGEGVIVAVLVARIGLDNMLPLSFLSALGPASQIIIVGPEGFLIMSYPETATPLGTNLSDSMPVARAMSRSRGTLIGPGPDGVSRIYAYTRLPDTNLHLLMGVNQASMMAPVDRATWSAGLTLLALSLIILIIVWIAGEQLIVAPVQSLADRLIRFGRGETDSAPAAARITELQPLVTAFEGMAAELTRRESALRNANRRLDSLASLDALTGIANRRSFDAALALQWNTVSQIAMLMIDIDKFKPFNDLYGHKEGDSCIRLVAQAMATAVRGTDIVARLGGEEFAVLMPSATLRSATEAAHRVRRAVEMVGIPHSGGPAGVVTVSIGCAACEPEPGLTSSDLMVAADKALYEAKAAGRNGVRIARDVVPQSGTHRFAPT